MKVVEMVKGYHVRIRLYGSQDSRFFMGVSVY